MNEMVMRVIKMVVKIMMIKSDRGSNNDRDRDRDREDNDDRDKSDKSVKV